MPQPVNRRRFLHHGVAIPSVTIAGMWLTSGSVRAIEPFGRNGLTKVKFSLAAYSYRNQLQGDPAQLSLTDFINDCAKMGLEGTELTSYYIPKPVIPSYLRQLKQQCFQLGLEISGTAVGNDFGFPEGAARRRQIASVKKWIEYSEILGAPVIRIFAGSVKQGSSPDQTHALIVSAIEECCDYAGQHGVHLALENHGGPTSTVDGLLAIVRDVKSPWFGVNLDTGNFHSQDIYGDLAKLASYALNVQVKVAISGPDNKREPSDFKRLASILDEAHYRGYVVLEYEEDGDPRVECPKYMDQLRAAFA
ncbi:MAG: sugar phosphate isomerase/epimerase [Pirellulales bacterium]|nr:sugar phosphate isomerase/epimerase [Pirellulales bacterium]